MKTTFSLLIVFLAFLIAPAHAQTVDEGTATMSQGNENAFTLSTQGLETKDLEDVLKDFLKDYKGRKNPKYDRRSAEYFVDDAEIEGASANTIDIYARVNQTGNMSQEILVWFDLGGAYLSSADHRDAAEYLRTEWFPELDNRIYTRMVEIELDTEEDKLKDFNKEHDDLMKDQKKLENDIADYQDKIKQAEKDLEQNARQQEEILKVIAEQQAAVEAVKKKLKKKN